MRVRAIRFDENVMKNIESVAKDRGFASPSAFIRVAVEQELPVRKEDIQGTEDRLAASVEQCGEKSSG